MGLDDVRLGVEDNVKEKIGLKYVPGGRHVPSPGGGWCPRRWGPEE